MVTQSEQIAPNEIDHIVDSCLHIERHTLNDYVRKWGGAASTVLFEPSCNIFRHPNIEGIIGFRIESGCAVVFGDPLCASHDIPKLVESFHKYCSFKKLKIVYVTASKAFAHWAMDVVCFSLIEAAEELILDPYRNPKSGSRGRALRNKVNHALKAGIAVEEYLERNAEIEKAIEGVGESWLKARKGPQIYLADVRLFAKREGKRWFYAKDKDRIIGVILLCSLESRKGWLVEFLMTTPEAPVGTSELLVLQAASTLREEECHFMSFGIAQMDNLGEIRGLGMISTFLARIGFKIAQKIFHLSLRRRYWRKFQAHKEHVYLMFEKKKIGIKEIRAIMKSLNVSL